MSMSKVSMASSVDIHGIAACCTSRNVWVSVRLELHKLEESVVIEVL